MARAARSLQKASPDFIDINADVRAKVVQKNGGSGLLKV
jgi:tRNA-dihydrouridine synthase